MFCSWMSACNSGDLRQVQNESIGGSSPHRTTPAENVALAVRFEPRALLFRLSHQNSFYQKRAGNAKQSRFARQIWFSVTIGQQLRFAVLALSLFLRALS